MTPEDREWAEGRINAYAAKAVRWRARAERAEASLERVAALLARAEGVAPDATSPDVAALINAVRATLAGAP